MARWISVCVALVAAFLAGIASASAQALVEENTLLSVHIDGRPYRLEAMIVKPAGATGRLPIALITHGRNSSAAENAKKRASDQLPQARDFAHRGWLAAIIVRRGFGLSDGREPPGVDCVRQDFRANFERNADDLAAALAVIARRPDADPQRVIAAGVSAGGAAVLALAARRPPGLLGVINVSGGLQLSRGGIPCGFEPGLIAAFSSFGARSRVPTMWLYAENDRLFSPILVRTLHDTYTRAGGNAELTMFPPISNDGHQLWGLFEGRKQWLPAVDEFLAAHTLPTWDRSATEAKLFATRIATTSRGVIESYLAAPSEKVLAISQKTHRAYWWAGGELAQMRERSQESCEQKTGEPCMILMENFRMIGAGAQASVR